MKSSFALLILLISFIPSSVLCAEAGTDRSGRAESVGHVLELIQKRYEKTRDIRADFIQETYSPGASEPVLSSGVVYFKRPEMMRWEYVKPEPQLIVVSGTDVYVYEKEAAQVMVLPRSQFLSSDVSRAFFSGSGSLEKFFRVATDNNCNLAARWCLRLYPRKPSGNLKELKLIVDPETHFIKELWIKDEMGGRTHISFRNIEVNVNLAPGLFRFEIPPGVDVYRTGAE